MPTRAFVLPVYVVLEPQEKVSRLGSWAEAMETLPEQVAEALDSGDFAAEYRDDEVSLAADARVGDLLVVTVPDVRDYPSVARAYQQALTKRQAAR